MTEECVSPISVPFFYGGNFYVEIASGLTMAEFWRFVHNNATTMQILCVSATSQ